jgi:diguanylate cyclase (GGDEF)-like protein
MKAPLTPDNEANRLKSLNKLNILDTPPEERFDRVTRLAKSLFNVPIALVSLVDSSRQWFKSCFGVDVSETGREISFCGHTILQDSVLVIEDASNDERFKDNPLVAGEPNIRFYAGYPLTSHDGYNLGTLCIIDDKPRKFSASDLAIFSDLGMLAQQELQAVQLATLDELTQISNRRGFYMLAKHALAMSKRLQYSANILFFDLTKFKAINDTFGHQEGDNVLRYFADCMLMSFRESDVLARLSGDEFAVILTNRDAEDIDKALKRFAMNVAEINQFASTKYNIEYAVGVLTVDDFDSPIDELLDKADKLMYANKAANQRS